MAVCVCVCLYVGGLRLARSLNRCALCARGRLQRLTTGVQACELWRPPPWCPHRRRRRRRCTIACVPFIPCAVWEFVWISMRAIRDRFYDCVVKNASAVHACMRVCVSVCACLCVYVCRCVCESSMPIKRVRTVWIKEARQPTKRAYCRQKMTKQLTARQRRRQPTAERTVDAFFALE